MSDEVFEILYNVVAKFEGSDSPVCQVQLTDARKSHKGESVDPKDNGDVFAILCLIKATAAAAFEAARRAVRKGHRYK